MTLKQAFSERLKHLMKQHDISMADLARKFEIKHPSVQKWCKGVTYPKPEIIIQLAQTFEVSLDFLLVGKEVHLAMVKEETPLYETKLEQEYTNLKIKYESTLRELITQRELSKDKQIIIENYQREIELLKK